MKTTMIQKAVRIFKLYTPFTKNTIQRLLSYRANVLIFILGDMLQIFVMYYLWKAIFAGSEEPMINGFIFPEMIIYIILIFLVSLVISGDAVHVISHEVKDGSIAMSLIKPLNFHGRVFAHSLGDSVYNMLLIGTPALIAVVIIAFVHNITYVFSIQNIVLFILSMTFSVILMFFYNFCFACISFVVTNIWGISQINNALRALLSGTLIPLVFFPLWTQKIFDFLPFSSMVYAPVMLFLGKFSDFEIVRTLVIQLVWTILLYALSKYIWHKAIKYLSVLGG